MIAASKPRLLSIVNAVTYGINALVTFGWPFISGKTNADLSKSYQTLITPNAAAFSIWGLIFLAQAIFVISTLASKRLMTHPLVVDGVGFKYVFICLTQALWTPAFGHEMMGLSAVLLGCILLGLLSIIKSQYATVSKIVERETSGNSALLTWKTFWLIQFPFELHLGWITAAFALGNNVLVVSLGGSAQVQVIVAALSLVVLATASVVWLTLSRPRITLALVAAWATFWMSFELGHPKSLILDTFSAQQIEAFRISTGTLSLVLVVLTAARAYQVRHWSKKEASPGEESAETESLLSEE